MKCLKNYHLYVLKIHSGDLTPGNKQLNGYFECNLCYINACCDMSCVYLRDINQADFGGQETTVKCLMQCNNWAALNASYI